MNQLQLLLTNSGMRNLWLASIFSDFGSRVFIFIIPIWMYNVTHSTETVAQATIVEMIAVILAGVAGGVVIDRLPKKRIFLFTNFAVIVILLPFLLIESFGDNSWFIMAGIFLLSLIMRIGNTNRSVLVNHLVPKTELMLANSMFGLIFSSTMMLGPVIGSAGLAFGNYKTVILFIVAGYLVVFLLGLPLKVDETAIHDKKQRQVIDEIREGFRHVRKNRVLWGGLLFMTFFMTASGIFASLFYVYAIEVLKVDGTIYALTYSMQGIGSVVASFFIALLSRRIAVHRLIGSALALMGILEIGYLLIPSIPLMLVSCLLIGILQQIAMVVANTVYQASCDMQVLGKVLGFRQMVTNLVMIAMTGLAIYFQALVGLKSVLISGAVLMFVSGLCGYLYVRDDKGQSA